MITLKKKPFKWMCAHRACQFTFDYQARHFVATGTATDEGEKLTFYIIGSFSDAIAPGDIIYADAAYTGYHVVKELINSQIIVTETDFVNVPVPQGNLKLITPVTFTIYSGYQTGALAAYLPYTKVATFLPEPNPQGLLVFDISGYINRIFDVIDSNDYATINAKKVYYNTFNQVQLVTSSGVISTHDVLNASIDMYELNEQYVDTFKTLNAGNLNNHYYSCGDSDNMIITGDMVTDWEQYVEQVHHNTGGFITTFNNTFYYPPSPPLGG